jgi:hypothetical protein
VNKIHNVGDILNLPKSGTRCDDFVLEIIDSSGNTKNILLEAKATKADDLVYLRGLEQKKLMNSWQVLLRRIRIKI